MSDILGLVEVQRRAETFLRTYFLGASPLSRGDRVRLIRPTEDDYLEVFGLYGPAARDAYLPLWANGPLPEPKAGQTELAVFVADGAMLGNDNPVSRRFPGGYRKIAERLDPDSVWVAFRYHAPGEPNGMFYDGLVPRPGDRWAWFPKPWRILPAADPL